ncbi:tudor domain-containing protein 3 [Rhodamnia argentea]|uniref:Tudor domain-containing protein 3 n=1 Tax=Rhodamnia argentea TaxID=178133 RepID=A0ABM3H9L1_9MYRT|nr:tudor domain-containing protein 3 [Rhodamnia argentea]
MELSSYCAPAPAPAPAPDPGPSSSSSSFFSSSEASVIETLLKRGWSLDNASHVRAVITIQRALMDDPSDAAALADAVEADLLNTDLRTIGSRSLPDRKASHLLGPVVLQISAVRDIASSSIEEVSKSSGGNRMLRLTLTDGHSEMTAIEYAHIPSLPDDAVPGTKVRLEKKVAINSGILCLTPTTLTVLGGVVQSLFDEWQMNRKYSGFSRESLKLSQQSDAGGPPPFEKLQIRASARPSTHQRRYSYNPETSNVKKSEGRESRMPSENKSVVGQKNLEMSETTPPTGKDVEKPTHFESRPKEVADSAPVQNQAAAQKLLQKMNRQGMQNQHFKGRKHKGKGKQEEGQVFTLDEWEQRNASAKLPNMSHDEELARQLQNQFDLEDVHHVREGPNETEAEKLRKSMFSYERDNDMTYSRGYGGGRRGRGRGRGRGRSHWRGIHS